MPEDKFGFQVSHKPEKKAPGEKGHSPAGWRVELPHQCDSWEIAPHDDYGHVPHADAVAGLEAFIAEAHEALAALRDGREFGNA